LQHGENDECGWIGPILAASYFGVVAGNRHGR